MSTAAAKQPPQPIQTAAEGENLVRHLLAAMDALVATVERETELVRAGKLKEAVTLEPSKSELARIYAADTAQVKANLPVLSKQIPELLASLRKRHELIQRAAADQSHSTGDRTRGLRRADPGCTQRGCAQERAADLR